MRLHRAKTHTLIEGDCLRALAVLVKLGKQVDAIVTDPPYELTAAKRTAPPPEGAGPFSRHRVGVNGDHRPVGGFMGKEWDGTGVAFSVDLWRLVLAVLKPGGYLLAFGGTRTYHRMTCAIEDAGFEIRDSLHWFYGTGFPKSLNVGEGRGTALKPAHEPIVLARKPLIGTVAANVLEHGTGGLNIDACRIEGGERPHVVSDRRAGANNTFGDGLGGSLAAGTTGLGRWPANVLLDEAAAAELDAQSGYLAGGQAPAKRRGIGFTENGGGANAGTSGKARDFEGGGASRFFYVAKPSRTERDAGCEHLTPKTGGEATDREDDSAGVGNPRAGAGRTGGAKNYHPTVKPVGLMRYLVRLVTPIGGTVLDPFTGSGTTGMAALLEGRDFVGIEREPEYFEIAKSRIAAADPTVAGVHEHAAIDSKTQPAPRGCDGGGCGHPCPTCGGGYGSHSVPDCDGVWGGCVCTA